MTARWIPDDHDLDAVARTLEPNVPSRETAEQLRTSLLASAGAQPQRARRSVAPFAFAGIAIAAAAAVVLWLGRSEPSTAKPKQVIASIGVARFERTSDWPDFAVRLDDGRIDVRVAGLADKDRFRVTTQNAEVEVRDAHVEIAAEHDRLRSVQVREGRVEVRPADQQVVILSAGETWSAPVLVQRDEVIAPPPPLPPAMGPLPPASLHAKPAQVVAAPRVPEPPAPSPRVHAKTAQVVAAPEPAPSAPVIAKPGEAEFRAGWAALRTGDPSAAAKAFSTACTEALHEPLGEDACFWTGAAAKRAGDAVTARAALEQFLQQFPGSPRATEASALLGWLLYDAGELDAAERNFHRAEHDRVPKVRDSAQRGLTAIQRKRAP